MEDRFLPRVWTGKEYYYPVFSELGITYENPNKEFSEENIKSFNWVFGWHFGICVQNGDKIEYIRNPSGDIEFDYTLEMPTGLKDKNDKLIYEGDILDFYLSNPRNGGHYKGYVFWERNNEYIGWMISDLNKEGAWDLRQIAHPNNWMVWGEVIGNIHETPKLLEKNNEF